MPIYQFSCTKCEHTEDLILSMNDWNVKKMKCPKCGGSWERVITAANLGKEELKMGVTTTEGSFVPGHFEK